MMLGRASYFAYIRGATVTSNKGKSYCPGHLFRSKDNDLL